MHATWVGTKHNPADDPSRDAALRNSVPWDDAHGPCPYSSPSADSLRESAPKADSDLQIWDFVEFFAGHAGISQNLIKQGWKCCAIEAYPEKGIYVSEHDLDLPEVQNLWLARAQNKQIRSCHFGIVCTTWGALHMLFNGGTRSRDKPLGDGSKPNEVNANKSVAWMCQMLTILLAVGSFFTIENPARSILFYHPRIVELVRLYSLTYVYFDQCEYGLRSPLGSEPREIWKKPTYILSNSPVVSGLHRTCKGMHTHTWIKGQVRVKGKYHTRSKLAGAYPVPLCSKLANVFLHILNASPEQEAKTEQV
jgi:hypothetical protein